LVSHWRIAAPAERVWVALNDAEAWPRWWPGVRSVQTLSAGGVDGQGSLRRVAWGTSLPSDLIVVIESIEVLRPERLRGRWRGPLRGEGLWLLQPAGLFTDVTCVCRVELRPSWMRWLAPLLRWRHAAAMRAGAAGLARHLGAAAVS
jgi:uncharacterized protein YndB with AHSA1/START domain